MTPYDAYTVHAAWHPSESLFLWGEKTKGGCVDAAELKAHLFAWDASSFYGTLIETAQSGRKEGVLLPAAQTLDFFCRLPVLEHAPVTWSGDLAELIRLAPAMQAALSVGKFMPDYGKWLKGGFGWKLDLAAEAELSPSVGQWADGIVSAWLRQRPEMRQRLADLEQRLRISKGLRNAAGSSAPLLDEEDWLTAIGWRTDAAPFRVCLQLVEPEQGRAWRLQVLLQDRARPEIMRVCDGRGEPLDGEPLPPEWGEPKRRILRETERWQRILPQLRESGEDGRPGKLRETLSHEEAWEFLTSGSLRLAEAGCSVFLPAWWERVRQTKPRLKARIQGPAGTGGTSLVGLKQIMQFDWRLAIGDMELTEAEFRELVASKQRLVRFRGRWVQLDPEHMEQILQTIRSRNRRGMTLRDVLEAHLLGGDAAESGGSGTIVDPDADAVDDSSADSARPQWDVELDGEWRTFLRRLERREGIPQARTPQTLQGTLRPYQLEGVSWLLFMRELGLGCCLADDMGLGKTIQWIAYLLAVRENGAAGPSLLICPTSVLGNWQKELRRFAPSLRVHTHYGPARNKGDAFARAAAGADLVLTTYALSHMDERELRSVEWDSICLDEAQNIKNAYTKQASAIRRLSGGHRIALTGTPIENRLSELWSIFDFMNPGYLGSLREFTRRFAAPVEKRRDPAATAAVQRLIRPFLLRREKTDERIRLNLPAKHETNVYVSLTAEQASLYESVIEDLFARLDRTSAMERRGLILASLTKLKQLCNHPSLLVKDDRRNWKSRSNKLERLLEMVGELRQKNERCLIFTQFVDTGRLLADAIERHLGEPVLFLHGGTPKAERDDMIARFQGEKAPSSGEKTYGVFLLSLRAGGIGLNLTAANHVFHFDRWWNPAVENQATDRAYRIGQNRSVQVYKFVTLGTLEERISDMIEQKQGLSRRIVGGGENWITELSVSELRELFALRNEWLESG